MSKKISAVPRSKDKSSAGAPPTLSSPVGFVNFDGLTGDNSLVEVRIPFDNISKIQRGQYVLLDGSQGAEAFLGRIVRGPFFTPDAVGKDSAFARAAILQGDRVPFLPDYHAICIVELLGRIFRDSHTLSGHATRPLPKTQVHVMAPEEIASLLNIDGDMYIGYLTGYEGIKVHFNSSDKKVLPRNLGIFGTVGSGKTNTSQVVIEEASNAGYSVVILDVEGEYISLDKPNSEVKHNRRISALMKEFGISAKGLDTLTVYRCTGTESKRKDAREFSINFGNISPYTLSEIMGFNEAQELRFMDLYYSALQSIEETPRKSRTGGSKWDRLKGEPVVGIDPFPDLTLDLLIKKLEADFLPNAKGADKSSWLKVRQLLHKLRRYNIFDPTKEKINASKLLKPGQVSVFDLSDSTNVRTNNIVIAEILRSIFHAKVENETLPPTMIVIEEAHTFVSRENVSRMESTLDMLREISRRGRKRWLSLCFISQQPAHLPNEIYELCNTKIVHQTTGKRNLDALRVSAGGVNEAIWGEVTVLGQGRAVIISPQFSHPVMCDVRPCRTNREYTD